MEPYSAMAFPPPTHTSVSTQISDLIKLFETRIDALEAKILSVEIEPDLSTEIDCLKREVGNRFDRLENAIAGVSGPIRTAKANRSKALEFLFNFDPAFAPSKPAFIPPHNFDFIFESAKSISSPESASDFFHNFPISPPLLSELLSNLYPLHIPVVELFVPAMLQTYEIEQCAEILSGISSFVGRDIVKKKVGICLKELKKSVAQVRESASESIVAALSKEVSEERNTAAKMGKTEIEAKSEIDSV